MEKRKVPTTIKIICIYFFILVIIYFITGMSFLIVLNAEEWIFSIISFIFSILLLILGINLWKLKEWARTGTIVLSICNIIFDIFLIFSGNPIYILSAIIFIAIIIDLSTNKDRFSDKSPAKRIKESKKPTSILMWLLIIFFGGGAVVLIVVIVVALLVGMSSTLSTEQLDENLITSTATPTSIKPLESEDCVSDKLNKKGYTDTVDCISDSDNFICNDDRYNAEVDARNECIGYDRYYRKFSLPEPPK